MIAQIDFRAHVNNICLPPPGRLTTTEWALRSGNLFNFSPNGAISGAQRDFSAYVKKHNCMPPPGWLTAKAHLPSSSTGFLKASQLSTRPLPASRFVASGSRRPAGFSTILTYAKQFKIPRMSHDAVELQQAQSQDRPEVPASLKAPTVQGWTEIYQWLDTMGEGFRSARAGPQSTLKTSQLFCTHLNTDSQIGFQQLKKDHPFELLIEHVQNHLHYVKSAVIGVACRRESLVFSVVLTEKDGAFSLGHNGYGQCVRLIIENEDYQKQAMTHRFSSDEKFVELVCGQEHSRLLNDKCSIYAHGLSADSRTGVGRYNNTERLTKCIGDVDGEKMVKLSCSPDCVSASNEKGHLFVWGNSEYGQLKLATTETQAPTTNAMPTLIPPTLFGQKELSDDCKVVGVYGGLCRFAAISTRAISTFGDATGSVLFS